MWPNKFYINAIAKRLGQKAIDFFLSIISIFDSISYRNCMKMIRMKTQLLTVFLRFNFLELN